MGTDEDKFIQVTRLRLEKAVKSEQSTVIKLQKIRELKARYEAVLGEYDAWRAAQGHQDAIQAAPAIGTLFSDGAAPGQELSLDSPPPVEDSSEVPTRGGKVVRWVILKRACDKLPGRVFKLKDLTQILEEHFPDFTHNSQALTRDLTRKKDLWRRVEGAYGGYEALWKEGESP